ncbi:MAG: transglycosylase SLT domain-containing protein [Gammaproteobacteria bacterium]|nr:transglycosylase SLT domain-containing protein [Gammaproteobacteria bacterium]
MLRILLIVCLLLLAGCSTSPPKDINNICDIFREKDDWYDDSKDSFQRWGVPIHVQLAIIYQESRFKHDAETEMQYFLWIIPIGRKSTAYGYAQVKDDTWEWYAKSTRNWGADRDDFADAVDFIGWYGNKSYETLKISRWDAYKQYLAYHEGHGGFKRKTYNGKPWLIKIARKVDQRAKNYRAQLASCEDELNSGWWFW